MRGGVWRREVNVRQMRIMDKWVSGFVGGSSVAVEVDKARKVEKGVDGKWYCIRMIGKIGYINEKEKMIESQGEECAEKLDRNVLKV